MCLSLWPDVILLSRIWGKYFGAHCLFFVTALFSRDRSCVYNCTDKQVCEKNSCFLLYTHYGTPVTSVNKWHLWHLWCDTTTSSNGDYGYACVLTASKNETIKTSHAVYVLLMGFYRSHEGFLINLTVRYMIWDLGCCRILGWYFLDIHWGTWTALTIETYTALPWHKGFWEGVSQPFKAF